MSPAGLAIARRPPEPAVQPKAFVGIGSAGSTVLRDFDIQPGAAVGALGHDQNLGRCQHVDQTVFAGRAHIVPTRVSPDHTPGRIRFSSYIGDRDIGPHRGVVLPVEDELPLEHLC